MRKRRLPAIADRAVREQVNKRTSWNKVGQRRRESMEGYRRKPGRDTLSVEKFAGYKTEVKERIYIYILLSLRNRVKEEEHL